ncbi:MAG: hypothetical protein ACREE6_06675 [Limisphaerales bacterium]
MDIEAALDDKLARAHGGGAEVESCQAPASRRLRETLRASDSIQIAIARIFKNSYTLIV